MTDNYFGKLEVEVKIRGEQLLRLLEEQNFDKLIPSIGSALIPEIDYFKLENIN